VTSARRRDANRRNARASTGPRTSASKARAAQNARRHGLSLPARYDPSRFDEIEALARAIAGADADAERLELARRIAEAQIDINRARAARRDLFPASPAALRERDAIARLAAIDRYERRAWSRRKRAIRALDDACTVEPLGDAIWHLTERSHGHLAERSQLRKAEQPTCVPPAPPAGGTPELGRAGSDAPSANLAERSQRKLARRSPCELAERSQGETFRVETAAGTLAERSQHKAFESKPAARRFGRTKPTRNRHDETFSRLWQNEANGGFSGCHRPRKADDPASSESAERHRFSAIGSARSNTAAEFRSSCPALCRASTP
jgi:hypothetical protein